MPDTAQALGRQRRSLPSTALGVEPLPCARPSSQHWGGLVRETDTKQNMNIGRLYVQTRTCHDSSVACAQREEYRRGVHSVHWGGPALLCLGLGLCCSSNVGAKSRRESWHSQSQEEGPHFESRGNCMCRGSRAGRRGDFKAGALGRVV